ncbi:zinc ribbon domain-containing protein [Methanoregula sp. PtaB.Bin085]|uniref:zinc ribbon domain-containing protein n=1 Tax=Methanoregula sp. PtaB.Bin085 TaxID=1811680 RepID=UPI0009C4C81D|nr:MAG: Double zinc ribbon [Methanoregula sp. PtaB.Bin085]
MTRRCSRCGGRVPAGVSFFCHRCGARLEGEEAAEYPVCPRCGRSQPDRNSHFCDRCGVQLVPPARPVSPDSRIQPVTTCPACGHPNPGDSIRYCKKCGSPLRGEMPHGQSHHGRSGDSGPDNAVRATVAHREIGRKKMPVQPEGLLSLLRRRISWKAAAGMAVIILVLSAVFFIMTGGSENPMYTGANSSPDTGTILPLSFAGIFDTGRENSSAGSHTGALSAGALLTAVQTTVPVPVSNRAAPVVTDKPLKMK